MLIMISVLELAAAAMQGGTCDALPPLYHGAGSWEPIKAVAHNGVTVGQCCVVAQEQAWTYYPSHSICYVDAGNGARTFHAGAPDSIMVPPAPGPDPEPEPELIVFFCCNFKYQPYGLIASPLADP